MLRDAEARMKRMPCGDQANPPKSMQRHPFHLKETRSMSPSILDTARIGIPCGARADAAAPIEAGAPRR
jgi:hypothetical protein